MNKIYMTKRGHDGKTVVCSEKTRARGKVKSLVLAVAAVGSMMASVDAMATTTLGDNQVISDTTSVAIGENVIATGADTVAVGDYTKASGDESTVIGKRATGFGNQSTATGSYAFADGNQSTSNGHASSAMATDTIAIGVNSGVAGGSMSKETFDRLLEIDKSIKEYFEPEERKFVYTTASSLPTLGASIDSVSYPIPYNNLMSSSGFDWTNPYSPETTISFPDVMAVHVDFAPKYSISSKTLEADYASALENLNRADANYAAFKPKVLAAYHDFRSSLQNTYSDTEIRDAFKIIARKADGATIAKYDNLPEQEKTRFDTLKNSLMYFNTYLAKWQNFHKDGFGGVGDEEGKLFANDDWVSDDWFTIGGDYSTTRIRQQLENQYNTLKEYLAQYPDVNPTELKAELTRLANEAGFDGTFESLSDVFGSKAGRAIAIGNSAYVSGDESVGVGYGNKVTGNQANVFGTHNTVTGDNNNVVGNNNTVATAGNNILGNAVTFAAGVATVGNVALGNDSVIGASVPTPSIDIRGTTYNFAGTNPTSVVTVGSAGKERQITNVAAGQVTATSTDAINGSQLYAVVKAVEDLEAGAADTNTDKSVRVSSGSDLLTVTGKAGAADGITTMTDYTVSINKGTFGTDPATGEVTAPTDGVATTADVAEAINSGSFAVTANGTKLADVGFGDTLSFVDGNGTKAVIKNGGVAYDLNIKSSDNSIITAPNADGSVDLTVNSSMIPSTVVDAGKGVTVTPVTNGNTTTYTVAVDDTIADKQYVADEIAKIKFPDVDLSGLITHEESVVAGDNISVSQDSKNSSGGKEFKVSLNSTLTGIDKIGGGTGAGSSISFGDNTINAGGATISNIANPVNATDAATKAYVDDKATTVAKGDGITVSSKTTTTPSGAVNTEYTVALDDATKAQLAKEESVSAGNNIVVKQDTKNATGGNNYNVSLASDLTGITSISNGDTTVKLGDGAVNVGGSTITNVASPVNATDAANKAYVDNSKTTVSKGDGITVTATPSTKDGATSVDYAVALDDGTKAKLAQVDVNKAAIAKGINTTADDGKVTNHPLGGIVAVLGDGNNIKTVTTDTGAISVQMADNLKVNSVVIEGSSVGMGAGGISAGGNKIYNVAPGTLSPSSMDAVNGSQLYATNMQVHNNAQNIGMLKQRMDEFDDALDAQAAGARAALGIPQVTLPGKSMVGVGLGNYGDAQALAVGFSRLSDNARTILKGSIDANTKDTNKFGVSLGLGFQW